MASLSLVVTPRLSNQSPRSSSQSEDRALRSAVFVHGSVKAAAKALHKSDLKGKSVKRIVERAEFLGIGAEGVDIEDVERRHAEREEERSDGGDDDGKWNEKRKYVPKIQVAEEGGGGKRLKKATASQDDDDDDFDLTFDEAAAAAPLELDVQGLSTQAVTQSQPKKIQMKGLFDSDDDE